MLHMLLIGEHEALNTYSIASQHGVEVTTRQTQPQTENVTITTGTDVCSIDSFYRNWTSAIAVSPETVHGIRNAGWNNLNIWYTQFSPVSMVRHCHPGSYPCGCETL